MLNKIYVTCFVYVPKQGDQAQFAGAEEYADCISVDG